MRVPAPDGNTYEVKTGKGEQAYDVFHKGQLVGGFVLEPEKTPVWIADAHRGQLSDAIIRQIADTFVDEGGGEMSIC